MARVCLVLLDGLNAATARRCLAALRALEEAGTARYTALDCALPPLSRPLYAALFSGLSPARSGILRNDDPAPCPGPTIFSLARAAGLTTAAAAYHWVHELCNGTPYDPARHRLTDDPALPISHGLFYDQDAYPDPALFADAACLCRRFAPHLLLVHSMGVDWAGHCHGAESREYRDAARLADGLLARWLPRWMDAGYAVLVTSDHGMTADGTHNDVTEAARRVPLWLAGKGWEGLPLPRQQTQVAGLVLQALGLNPDALAALPQPPAHNPQPPVGA
ncbi:alkaline phosphatase family protein [Desulfovibrio legallii]|uniref:Type I phosphodiesterase / nucleotide pyrophosphatase n=1 Tax=Desulfovibrio legallii TaxID=571438 RepID=A0A1G7IZ12_9BACT|nr:alkaline phosphatase family protein [Desulfovibrio legallii]SDF17539.1 Type I phosphodiesterase / nucleotide pyrophosphatase [Desulfovibrio legallii]